MATSTENGPHSQSKPLPKHPNKHGTGHVTGHLNGPGFSHGAVHVGSPLLVPIWIIAILGLGVLMRDASIIFLWIVSAFLLFAFVDPLMQRMNRLGIAPMLSALFLVTIASAAAGALGLLLYNSFPSLLVELEAYRSTAFQLYENGSKTFTGWMRALTHVRGQTVSTTTTTTTSVTQGGALPPLGGLGATMLHGLGTAITVVTFAVLVPILSFFLIAERKTFAGVFGRGLFAPGQGEIIWKQITDSTGAFFLGNFILVGLSFPVFWLIFLLFGIPSALAMAAISSVVNLIPFLGALLAGALPTLSLISHHGTIASGASLFGICLLVHFLVANLITPKILGSRMNLNATVSTIALVAWGQLWGALGLLLAIPMTSVIKIVFQYSGNERLHWIAMLMSDDPDSLLKQGYRRFKKREIAPRDVNSIHKSPDRPVLNREPSSESEITF